MKKQYYFVVGFTLLMGMLFSTFMLKQKSETLEALQDRTFTARVMILEITTHQKVDCPELNEFQPIKGVVRLKFDRQVMIWSENGTGKGLGYATDTVDLDINANDQKQRALEFEKLIGKGPMTFHYSQSFLSICDSSRIPTIQKMDVMP